MSTSPSTQAESMASSTVSSFVLASQASSTTLQNDDDADDSEDLESLPSISSSILDAPSDDGLSDAQREWEASLEQLQLLLTMIILPFAGKFLGRKFAYWSMWSCVQRRMAGMFADEYCFV
jgi:hypothetical protein